VTRDTTQGFFAALTCLSLTTVCLAASPAQKRPNILFVYAAVCERLHRLLREELRRCDADFVRLVDRSKKSP
jgi:hypothetical protein